MAGKNRLSVDESDLVFEENGVLPELRTAENDPMTSSSPRGLTVEQRQKVKDALRNRKEKK